MLKKCIHILKRLGHFDLVISADSNSCPNNLTFPVKKPSDLKDKNPVFLKIFWQIKSLFVRFRGAESLEWVWWS